MSLTAVTAFGCGFNRDSTMSSVQTGGVIAALGIAEQMLPQLQAVLPPTAYGVLGILVMLARVILQPKLSY